MDANYKSKGRAAYINVSIHAPVMDANLKPNTQNKTSLVSIHAPVMDANYVGPHLHIETSFNPRARDGRELILAGVLSMAKFQSTRP